VACAEHDGLCGSRCCDGTLIATACRMQRQEQIHSGEADSQDTANQPLFFRKKVNKDHSGKVVLMERPYDNPYPKLKSITPEGHLYLDNGDYIKLTGVSLGSQGTEIDVIHEKILSWTMGKPLLIEQIKDQPGEVYVFILTGFEHNSEGMERYKKSLDDQQFFPVMKDGQLSVFLNATLIRQNLARPVNDNNHPYRTLFTQLNKRRITKR
jgi:hypothetical protein